MVQRSAHQRKRALTRAYAHPADAGKVPTVTHRSPRFRALACPGVSWTCPGERRTRRDDASAGRVLERPKEAPRGKRTTGPGHPSGHHRAR
jgi:hypothetical protein